MVDVAGSVTNGTLSNPVVTDDNSGKQVADADRRHPDGGPGARSVRGIRRVALPNRLRQDSKPAQQSFGADAEYSRDHWIVRWELVWSRWGFPHALIPDTTTTLDSVGSWVEGRYRLTPRMFVAGRADRLGFSTL